MGIQRRTIEEMDPRQDRISNRRRLRAELNHTGYMHNRCRMIVASFLAKDLLIDWRMGERYFMEHLIDGDFASNNGGWGFSSSTGVDPQPYFWIFNPLLQSEKFDPDGDYIRKWVPELKDVKGKAIHDPYGRGAEALAKKNEYPRQIVDHKSPATTRGPRGPSLKNPAWTTSSRRRRPKTRWR